MNFAAVGEELIPVDKKVIIQSSNIEIERNEGLYFYMENKQL